MYDVKCKNYGEGEHPNKDRNHIEVAENIEEYTPKKRVHVIYSDVFLKNNMVFRTRYPLKLNFQIAFVFPVQLKNFPVSISVICDYFICKSDLVDPF